jgi:hypothetical protein
MRRVISDALISVGALLLLLVALVSIDDRVRERIQGVMTSPPSSSDIASFSAQVQNVSTVVYKAARDRSVERAPMVIFGVAAGVLVLFMLRT